MDFTELLAFKKSFSLAMEIFNISKSFPKEETYSLTDQIRRSSRSVCSNFAEAYRKRFYTQHFIKILTDCDAECSETSVWLDFSKDCNYISEEQHSLLKSKCDKVGSVLGNMISNPENFQKKPENSKR